MVEPKIKNCNKYGGANFIFEDKHWLIELHVYR